MTFERDLYMRRQEQDHDLLRMRTRMPSIRTTDACFHSLRAESQPVPRYVHEEPRVEVVPESRVASSGAVASGALAWVALIAFFIIIGVR